MAVHSQASLLLKPGEAATLLAVSQRTLWSLTREGTIPCVRLGRSVRYSVETLRAVIAENERGGGGRPDATLPSSDKASA
jgi:excisionase family DNA binding protein